MWELAYNSVGYATATRSTFALVGHLPGIDGIHAITCAGAFEISAVSIKQKMVNGSRQSAIIGKELRVFSPAFFMSSDPVMLEVDLISHYKSTLHIPFSFSQFDVSSILLFIFKRFDENVLEST